MSLMSVKIVVVGGGTGSFAVLSGLKNRDCELSALVSMADDGGSTGVLRDELDVLPPGDVRQCLVALSSAPQQLQDLFAFRFAEGSLAGHSFGNLFLSAVQKMTDDFGEAVRLASDVLQVRGRVIPITLDDVRLVIAWADQAHAEGESAIDVMRFGSHIDPPSLRLEPAAHINQLARQAIFEADMIVVAPGDIYTSLGPLLIVEGVGEALRQTKARIIYVCNLVTKPGQTEGLSVADHAAEIERFAGAPILDIVLFNTGRPSPALARTYAAAGEHLVRADQKALQDAHYKVSGCDLLSLSIAQSGSADPLAVHRSLIRHDPEKLAEALLALHVHNFWSV